MGQQVKVAGGNESVELADAVFGRTFNGPLIHQVVTAERAAARAGTKQQKNRSDVRGGGKKPWRQKGTGRARAGTIRSPIWTGGGVTFAARPRSFKQKVNKKMYRGALRSMLSAMSSAERLAIIADFSLTGRRTKDFLSALTERNVADADLIVVSAIDDALIFSSRNVANIDVVTASRLGVADLVASEKVAVTASAKASIEERLA